ncbi:MAG: MOSC domain-containing protein [Pseudomonadota bacterium]|nr:MOSC domain-containing protein [Pseudomonadota bacterium]
MPFIDSMATITVQQLSIGTSRPLPPEGQASAIFKQPTSEPLILEVEGFVGDQQADRRVHGGPERAVCQYPSEHYRYWRQRHRGYAEVMSAGLFGENLSTVGATEHDVRIGDVFRLGTALIQISQPRRPCWKVEHRSGVVGLAQQMSDTGRSGWLYRVCQPGAVEPGDGLILADRLKDAPSVAETWQIANDTRPPMDVLAALAKMEALAQVWRQRFSQRLEWLRSNG